MKNLKKEFLFIMIALLPFFYLVYLWNGLPARLPMHYNIKGEIDRYGNKSELILLIAILSGLGYFTFLIIPKIDPKQKLQNMGKKLESLRLILAVFMTILALIILNSSSKRALNPNLLFVVIGLLFAFLGNYFKTITPNYFIGIKTPWTLDNETVWKKTHLLAGKLWLIGGILIVFTYFTPKEISIILFFAIIIIITIVPIIYSYLEFKKQKIQAS